MFWRWFIWPGGANQRLIRFWIEVVLEMIHLTIWCWSEADPVLNWRWSGSELTMIWFWIEDDPVLNWGWSGSELRMICTHLRTYLAMICWWKGSDVLMISFCIIPFLQADKQLIRFWFEYDIVPNHPHFSGKEAVKCMFQKHFRQDMKMISVCNIFITSQIHT